MSNLYGFPILLQRFTKTNAAGCDSIVNTRINNQTIQTQEQTLKSLVISYYLGWWSNLHCFYSVGYVYQKTNVAGCDSIVTID